MTGTVDFQIIANFMAGKGIGRKILSDLEIFLKNHDKTFDVLAVEKPTPISLLPGHNLEIREGVICIGGDGTVSESMGYLLNKNLDLPLAIIPAGTANIIATSLGLSNFIRSFNFLLERRIKAVDIGVADFGKERDFFLLGLGLGFEENFLKMTKERDKSSLGIFSYLFSALAELLRIKKIELKIKADEKSFSTQVCTLMVLNTPPKILKIFPLVKDKKLTPCDQLLNLYYVEYKNFFQSFWETLILHVVGKVNFGHIKSMSGKEFYLESDLPVGTQVDGELKGNLPVRVSIHPSKLKLLL